MNSIFGYENLIFTRVLEYGYYVNGGNISLNEEDVVPLAALLLRTEGTGFSGANFTAFSTRPRLTIIACKSEQKRKVG